MDNTDILEYFFETKHIPIRRGSIFKSSSTQPSEISFHKVRGMMLGLAIGDALGAPSEGMLPDNRRAKYGDIRDYQPNRDDGRRVGIPTDDSQLAFWTLEQMLEDGEFIADNVAARFCQDQLYGMGGSIREFIKNYKDENQAWFVAGAETSGNGALMRIPAMVIPHLQQPDGLWADTALSAMITHRDSASIAACVAYSKILWELLLRERPPEFQWWSDQYVSIARELETDDSHTPRDPGNPIDFRGPLWKFVDRNVPQAYVEGRTVLDVSNGWHSGAYLLETVPTSLYILMRHASDPEDAIVRAVTDSKDNDTVGAIVGAAVGALHGEEALPERWVADLTGRTKARDEGKMFELLDQAERQWG